MGYFDSKYTGEEVEHRLDKVEANEESIAAIEGRVTEAEGKITEAEEKIAENAAKVAEVEGKADANENKIAEVDEATKKNADGIASLGEQIAEVDAKADANEAKIAEVEGKANANATAIEEVGGKANTNTESIAEIGGKVTEIEGSITEMNGSIETLLEGVTAVEAKADSNNEAINTLVAKFYLTDFTMAYVRTAAAIGTLSTSVRSFYNAIASGKLVYIRDNVSSGVGMGACVPQTYEKNGIATAVIYDTVDRKWYTLSAAQSDRTITVTASDTVNLMDNEIYKTDFTMQQLIAALGESDSVTWSVSTTDFAKAIAGRKSIFIPDATNGGYISLSGANSNNAVFYVAANKMFLKITVSDENTLNLYRRFFDATGYVDIESAYKLSGNDGQGGGAIGAAMDEYKIQYRATACPTFAIGSFPLLKVGQVLNLRFIFTAGLGGVSFANNSNWQIVRDSTSSTSNSVVPAIVDVTAINPAEGAKTVVFYTIKKYNV